MLRSSSSLMAEDVTIRCRIRRISDSASMIANCNDPHGNQQQQRCTNNSNNKNNNEGHEMICTIRNWETTKKKNISLTSVIVGRRTMYTSGIGARTVQAISSIQAAGGLVGGDHHDIASNSHSTTGKQQQQPQQQQQQQQQSDCHTGPELVLIPIEQSTIRDDSPLRRSRCINKSQLTRHGSPSPPGIAGKTSSPYNNNNNNNNTDSNGSNNNTKNNSNNSNSSNTNLPQLTEQFSIQLSDIVLAYTFLNTKPPHRINISTFTTGIYEFHNLTDNALDILMAFLQAFVSSDRIVQKVTIDFNDNTSTKNTKNNNKSNNRTIGSDKNGVAVKHSASSVSSCIDIDTLHAKHLEGRAANETWPEKFTRRLGHVVSSLSELCDAACCSSSSSSSSITSTTLRSSDTIDRRDMPEQQQNNNHNYPRHHPHSMTGTSSSSGGKYLEIDDNVTEWTNTTNQSKNNKPRSFNNNNNSGKSPTPMITIRSPGGGGGGDDYSIPMLPSGLSVEPDDAELESRYHDQ